MKNILQYWQEKHTKYSQQDWITKPTIFAKSAIKFFPKRGKLLELAAGQGQDSRFFAMKGYEVTSIDFSDKALFISKDIAKKADLKIEFKNLNLQNKLQFPKNHFDVVYSHLGIHYFNKQRTKELFEEIYNVLKTGGIFALLLNTVDDPEINDSRKIEDYLYETPSHLIKRFFSTGTLNELIGNKYEILILDNKGETYKDTIKTLIRFVGRKKL